MEEKKNDLEFSVCSVTHIHAYLLKPAFLLFLFFSFQFLIVVRGGNEFSVSWETKYRV